MVKPVVILANGDQVVVRGTLTRSLAKEINKRRFQNIKMVRGTDGKIQADNIDMGEQDEVNDFVVGKMIETVLKVDGSTATLAMAEYINGMDANDFTAVLEAVNSVLNPKSEEEGNKEKKG